MSGIAVFNKAVSTLQDSQRNLFAISQARQKLEQEKELFGLKKKKMDLEIETARKEGRMTDLQADAFEAQTKTYLQQEQDKMKGKIAAIKVAQQENATIADKAMQFAKLGFRSDPQGVMGFLQARDRNAARTTELRPKVSYGKIGYETVDVGEEEEAKSTNQEVKNKDVANLAVRLAQQSGAYDADPEDYMEKASKMLSGDIKSSKMKEATSSEIPKKASSKFKAGDIREKNGVRYKRNENGQWLPLS